MVVGIGMIGWFFKPAIMQSPRNLYRSLKILGAWPFHVGLSSQHWRCVIHKMCLCWTELQVLQKHLWNDFQHGLVSYLRGFLSCFTSKNSNIYFQLVSFSRSLLRLFIRKSWETLNQRTSTKLLALTMCRFTTPMSEVNRLQKRGP